MFNLIFNVFYTPFNRNMQYFNRNVYAYLKNFNF